MKTLETLKSLQDAYFIEEYKNVSELKIKKLYWKFFCSNITCGVKEVLKQIDIIKLKIMNWKKIK